MWSDVGCKRDCITASMRRRVKCINNIYSKNVVEWTAITREPQSAVPAECVMKDPFSRVHGACLCVVW